MRRAIFPGSFNPFTIGHEDIVKRGLLLFDEVIIAIGINAQKSVANTDAREEHIRALFHDEPRVRVVQYSCLTTELAEQLEAQFILRGVRSTIDFEYERNIAEANRQLSGIETILLYSKPEYGHISSSLVRELQSYGKDVSQYLP